MKNKGITLIALVITVIVLLILAGIGIAILTGENGILETAMQAKEKTELAEIEEQLRLAQLAAKTNQKGGKITVDDVIKELDKQGVNVKKNDDETIVCLTLLLHHLLLWNHSFYWLS